LIFIGKYVSQLFILDNKLFLVAIKELNKKSYVPQTRGMSIINVVW
jgi:hypothetical protein